MKKLHNLIFSIIAAMLLVSCNMGLYDVIETLPEFEESPISIGSPFKPEVAPDFVRATVNAYKDHIDISWRGVPGAKSYQVERREAGSEEWLILKNTAYNNLTYVDSVNESSKNSIVPGISYEYRVRARSSEGVYGAFSDVVEGKALTCPTGIEVSKGDSSIPGIKITWNRLDGVSSYRIFMKVSDYTSFIEVGMVSSTIDDSDCVFIYPISDSENPTLVGKELFFAVKAIAPSSAEMSDLSVSRVGYSYVKGSPVPVQNLVIDQAENTDFNQGIKLVWDDLGPEFDYMVYRSAPGSEEIKIYKVYPSQKLDRNGKTVTFIDNNDVNAFDTSVEYTYSVIATTEKDGVTLKGLAVDGTGYFIAPPENLKFERVIQDPEKGFGFEISFENPCFSGQVANVDDWKFNIYGFKSSDISEADYDKSFENFKSREKLFGTIKTLGANDVTEIAYRGAPENGKYLAKVYFGDVNMYDSFAVTFSNADGSMETYPGRNAFFWGGTKLETSVASQNVYEDGMVANSNGVYPVKLTFTYNDYGGVPYIKAFKLFVEGSDVAFTEFTKDAEGFHMLDTSDHRLPGRMYSYYVELEDVFGHKAKSEINGGYGGLTPEIYTKFFVSTAFKPWEDGTYLTAKEFDKWKNSSIGKKIQYGYAGDLSTQLQSMGEATERDSIRGGVVNYNASQEGIGGQIYFNYNRFGLTDYMYLTGAYEMHVNASGTGSTSSKTGGITVEGLYPGHVGWGGLQVVSKKFQGSYKITVEYSNGNSVTKTVSAVI